jgi:hypothetical protein
LSEFCRGIYCGRLGRKGKSHSALPQRLPIGIVPRARARPRPCPQRPSMENCLDLDCLVDIEAKVDQRNAIQAQPIQDVYLAYEDILKKVILYEKQRDSLRHKLCLMEYELHELVQKEEYLPAVNYVKRKFSSLQSDLACYTTNTSININSTSDTESLFDLAKLVHDQKKLITNLQEEVQLAKSEYKQALEHIATLAANSGNSNASGTNGSSSVNRK